MRLFKRMREYLFKRKEYLYLFILPTRSFDEEVQKEETGLRTQIIEFIKNDLLKSKKQILYSDIMVDSEASKTYFVFTSDNLSTNIFLRPIFYEIYAYKKSNKIVFTYPIKKIFYQNIEILKFTIKCK